VWVKACTSLAFADWTLAQLLARLRGRGGEPLGPTTRAFLAFLGS